jgi:hypothetical protein
VVVVVLSFFYLPAVPNDLGATVGMIQVLLQGAIIALMFTPDVAAKFRRKPEEE